MHYLDIYSEMNSKFTNSLILTFVGVAVFILIIIIGIILCSVSNNKKKQKRIAEEQKFKQEFLQVNNVIISKEYVYKSSRGDVEVRFIIDTQNDNLIFLEKGLRATLIPVSEIIDFSVKSNDRVDVQVNSGAIVGERVYSYKIVIDRENLNFPRTEINLVHFPIYSKFYVDYYNLTAFASQVYASIKALMSSRSKKIYYSNILIKGKSPLIADELEKLAALKDKGLITENDFNIRKQKLIDS